MEISGYLNFFFEKSYWVFLKKKKLYFDLGIETSRIVSDLSINISRFVFDLGILYWYFLRCS